MSMFDIMSTNRQSFDPSVVQFSGAKTELRVMVDELLFGQIPLDRYIDRQLPDSTKILRSSKAMS